MTSFVLGTDLTGSELVDQQSTSLRVLPAVQAVQFSGHLVELLISVIELCQELRVRPLRRDTNKHEVIFITVTEKRPQ